MIRACGSTCSVFLWLWLTFWLSVVAAASWGFDDATIAVQGKKAGTGGGFKEKLAPGKILSSPVILGDSDTIKVLLTIKEDKKVKRPHQASLRLEDPTTGLDTTFILSIKDNGKAKVDITQKDLPSQFLKAQTALRASIVIGSFGATKPYDSPAFEVKIDPDSILPIPSKETPTRYGKLDEIHHHFRADPTSPSILVTIPFVLAVLAAVPVLFTTWGFLGANVNHAPKAFGSAPLPYAVFLSSILAMEGTFYMYYRSWNLFQTLPVAIGIGILTFLSGSRALREVQGRRLAGLR